MEAVGEEEKVGLLRDKNLVARLVREGAVDIREGLFDSFLGVSKVVRVTEIEALLEK